MNSTANGIYHRSMAGAPGATLALATFARVSVGMIVTQESSTSGDIRAQGHNMGGNPEFQASSLLQRPRIQYHSQPIHKDQD